VLRKIVKDFIRFVNHEEHQEHIGRDSPLIPPSNGGRLRGMAIHLRPVLCVYLSIFVAVSRYYASVRTF